MDKALPIWARWDFDHWKCVQGNAPQGYTDIPWPRGFPADKLPLPKYKIGSVVSYKHDQYKPPLKCTIIEIGMIHIEDSVWGFGCKTQLSSTWWISSFHYTVKSSWHDFWASEKDILEVFTVGDGFLH